MPSKNFFFGVQYHPEFNSTHFRPNPVFLGLLLGAIGKLKKEIENGPFHSLDIPDRSIASFKLYHSKLEK
jgi:hypothetical protein